MNNKKPIILAGGGVVTNEHGDLLMIFRRGKWDLPKGKLDKGETIEACALREVTEETGVQNLTLGKLVIPQTEEDITAIEWTKPSAIASRLQESYETIKTVIESSELAN